MNEAVGRESAQLAMKTLTSEILITDAAVGLTRRQHIQAKIGQTLCLILSIRLHFLKL